MNGALFSGALFLCSGISPEWPSGSCPGGRGVRAPHRAYRKVDSGPSVRAWARVCRRGGSVARNGEGTPLGGVPTTGNEMMKRRDAYEAGAYLW